MILGLTVSLFYPTTTIFKIHETHFQFEACESYIVLHYSTQSSAIVAVVPLHT